MQTFTNIRKAEQAAKGRPILRISTGAGTDIRCVLYIVGPADLEAVRDMEVCLFPTDVGQDLKKGHLAAIF